MLHVSINVPALFTNLKADADFVFTRTLTGVRKEVVGEGIVDWEARRAEAQRPDAGDRMVRRICDAIGIEYANSILPAPPRSIMVLDEETPLFERPGWPVWAQRLARVQRAAIIAHCALAFPSRIVACAWDHPKWLDIAPLYAAADFVGAMRFPRFGESLAAFRTRARNWIDRAQQGAGKPAMLIVGQQQGRSTTLITADQLRTAVDASESMGCDALLAITIDAKFVRDQPEQARAQAQAIEELVAKAVPVAAD